MDLKGFQEYLNWFETTAKNLIITETVDNAFYYDTTISWDILRTDLIHSVCSGNKFFKLKYYLQDAFQKNHTIISTAGGAWSNHIVASAYAAKACGFKSIGYIRGEPGNNPSATLLAAAELGMELRFVARQNFTQTPTPELGEYFIPAGGYGEPGARGAAEILKYTVKKDYTHIICAAGTGTMLAGLSLAAPEKRIIGLAVLKHSGLGKEAEQLTSEKNIELIHNYHFGGYAKKTETLLAFMNEFYEATGIPTDFVYTGKLMYGIRQLIQQQFFAPGSKILAIHSGGLQGNKSLKKSELIF